MTETATRGPGRPRSNPDAGPALTATTEVVEVFSPAPEPVVVPEGHKLARVTKLGDGKIATGVPGGAPDYELNTWHARGDEVILTDEVAALYEARGWVEAD